MRYLVAILFGLIGAVMAFKLLADPIATWASLQFKFESSDDADNLNQMAALAVMLGGLIVGWTIGWALGGPLKTGPRPK